MPRADLGRHFPMAVGGGGNCGREPVASIRRMGPGDALVSIQEYVVTAKMRHHLTRTYMARPRCAWKSFPTSWRMLVASRSTGPRSPSATVPRLRRADLTAGRPSRVLRDQIDSLLTGLPLPN